MVFSLVTNNSLFITPINHPFPSITHDDSVEIFRVDKCVSDSTDYEVIELLSINNTQ